MNPLRTFSTALVALALLAPAGLAIAQGQPAPAAGTAAPAAQVRAQSVTVNTVGERDIVRKVLVAGTFVARDEVLVSPEIEGVAIVELLVEEGTTVKAGQVLARLSRTTLEVQLAQNAGALARAEAAIEQAQASILEADANRVQAVANLKRSESLQKSGFTSVETIDTRVALARATEARLTSSRNALLAARADLQSTKAQRQDIEVKLGRTEIKAPRGGMVSRRPARLGAIASMAGEPLFRIIAEGAVELEAEAAEADLALLRNGQAAIVSPASEIPNVPGTVRLVSPEVDRTTRLGKVRIALPVGAPVLIGGFARASIEAARSRSVAAPVAALAYGRNGTSVQVVREGRVSTRAVQIGLVGDGYAQIVTGLTAGEQIVAKAGVFVRDGDVVNVVQQASVATSGTARP
jgi:HlyD family secretion protein